MLCVDFLYVRSIRHDFRDRDAKTTTFTDKKTDTYQLYNIVPHGDFKDRGAILLCTDCLLYELQ